MADLTYRPLTEEALDALARIDNPLAAIERNRGWAARRNPKLRELLDAQPEDEGIVTDVQQD